MHHSSQITVLAMMLTWHPSAGISSRLIARVCIIFDSVSGFWKGSVPREIQQMGIQNYYGEFNGVWCIINTWMCVFISVKFPKHSSLRVYSAPFVSRNVSNRCHQYILSVPLND